jgi:outer membrane protein
MKIEMRKFVLLVVLGFGAIVSQAQTTTPSTATKIGYADVDYIYDQMPESKQIEAELKSLQTQLKNQIDTKYADFQKKLADYQQNLNTMLEAVRANTERELQQLQQNLQKLQEDAQTTIQNKQVQLMQPVYKKMGDAVEAVAKENGFSLILTSQVSGFDVVLYADDNSQISDLVLKKMGITPKPAASTATPQTQPK